MAVIIRANTKNITLSFNGSWAESSKVNKSVTLDEATELLASLSASRKANGHFVIGLYNAAGVKKQIVQGSGILVPTLSLLPAIDLDEGVQSETLLAAQWKVGPTNFATGSKIEMIMAGDAKLGDFTGSLSFVNSVLITSLGLQGVGSVVISVPFAVVTV